ncbi:hypothetical protein [Acinetobacter sp. Leaf130]|uniref:hypothetical protein n=1 Tax=Acinetobacter sp. Leaf130 TaxID=1736269 RepID=UPI0006F697AB|nr:hypothetical protein [Acinetobacter sp. Leaf130]KQQ77002.1 hypothetical protein ASF86_05725 [Acinetobacter sp. Leaf130]
MEKLISGEIAIFINSLGLVQGDDEMLNSIMLIGTSFEYDESSFEDNSYYLFFKGGLSIYLKKRNYQQYFSLLNQVMNITHI